jgi:hypothetical protein
MLARAHVLIGLRLEVAFAAATFLASFSLINGPFFKLRDIQIILQYASSGAI